MRIDPDSRTLSGLSTFLGFIALNVMYLLTCVPIVTIGAATSALYEVTIRYADDESGRPVADYLPAFAANLRRATPLALLLLAGAVALAFAAVFWFAYPNPWAAGGGVIAGIASAYLFATFLHAMALVAVFRTRFRRTLKNALLLPAAQPVRTAGLVLIPATLVALTVVFPPFGLIVATIGFSVGAYGSAFLFRGIYERLRGE